MSGEDYVAIDMNITLTNTFYSILFTVDIIEDDNVSERYEEDFSVLLNYISHNVANGTVLLLHNAIARVTIRNNDIEREGRRKKFHWHT